MELFREADSKGPLNEDLEKQEREEIQFSTPSERNQGKRGMINYKKQTHRPGSKIKSLTASTVDINRQIREMISSRCPQVEREPNRRNKYRLTVSEDSNKLQESCGHNCWKIFR
ncbi:hypothetical protein CEXT_411281 [Caerostris extrusa]|uniref:Uncharacterized protein n=1 Tax=Caerostris extrusa TaxID=172846 RepID=A0AAV4PLB5_CAEEX|nr:hypothetical protein CEXT_411281 [Caerostris extrusa]